MADQRDRARRLVAAMRFQKRVLEVLDVGLDHLTTREQVLLDACMQVYLDELKTHSGRPGDSS